MFCLGAWSVIIAHISITESLYMQKQILVSYHLGLQRQMKTTLSLLQKSLLSVESVMPWKGGEGNAQNWAGFVWRLDGVSWGFVRAVPRNVIKYSSVLVLVVWAVIFFSVKPKVHGMKSTEKYTKNIILVLSFLDYGIQHSRALFCFKIGL